MGSDLETTRVYLNTTREGVVTCHSCGIQRTVNITKAPENFGGKSFTVQCQDCGGMCGVHFELRQWPRRTVYLSGPLLHSRTRVALTLITVTSLAAGGLAFVVKQKMLLPKGRAMRSSFFLTIGSSHGCVKPSSFNIARAR